MTDTIPHFVKNSASNGDNFYFDLLYVGAPGNPNPNTTIGFNQSTGVFTDEHSNNDPDTFSSTENGTYTTTLTITSDNSEVHMKRGNGEYLGFFTLSGWNSASTSTYNYTVRINGTTSSTETITLSSSTPTPTIQSVSINNGAWTDHTFVPDDNAVSGKYAWDLQHDAGSGFYKIGDLHSLEYIPGYGWFVINVNGDGFGDVSPTSSTSGTYLDANGTSQSFSSNFASSSNGVLIIAHGGGTITLNEADFFTNGVLPTPTFRTGTSQNFNFSGGTWGALGYSFLVDDTPSTASSGVVINGVRQWEWDLNIGGNVNTGANDFVRFVPGTSVGTGTWSKSNGETGVRGTTNTNEISFINPSDGDIEIIIHETDAFVDGLVPYGDIP